MKKTDRTRLDRTPPRSRAGHHISFRKEPSVSRRVALATVLVVALLMGAVTPGLGATLPEGGSSAGGTGIDPLNLFGLGKSAGSGEYEEGEGLAFENQAKRRKAFLQAHMDSRGDVRPRLWRRG